MAISRICSVRYLRMLQFLEVMSEWSLLRQCVVTGERCVWLPARHFSRTALLALSGMEVTLLLPRLSPSMFESTAQLPML